MATLGRAVPGERTGPALETDCSATLDASWKAADFFCLFLAQLFGKSRFGKENAKESKDFYLNLFESACPELARWLSKSEWQGPGAREFRGAVAPARRRRDDG
jgi:hypothetical protein